MPRRNKRDKRYEPKDYSVNSQSEIYSIPSEKQKPTRRRKSKWDKRIYKDED